MTKTSPDKNKLQEAEDDGVTVETTKRDIRSRIKNLEDERAASLEVASANKEALRGQIDRIKETIDKVLKKTHHSPGKTENVIQRARHNNC